MGPAHGHLPGAPQAAFPSASLPGQAQEQLIQAVLEPGAPPWDVAPLLLLPKPWLPGLT